MGVDLIWDNEERTILRYIFDNRWTWDEIARATLESHTALDAVPHNRVAIIFEAPPDIIVPSDTLVNARRALTSSHRKASPLVFVLVNPLARMIVNTLAHISGSVGAQMYVVDSLAEARRVIATHYANV
jgi:hypothetical protein